MIWRWGGAVRSGAGVAHAIADHAVVGEEVGQAAIGLAWGVVCRIGRVDGCRRAVDFSPVLLFVGLICALVAGLARCGVGLRLGAGWRGVAAGEGQESEQEAGCGRVADHDLAPDRRWRVRGGSILSPVTNRDS